MTRVRLVQAIFLLLIVALGSSPSRGETDFSVPPGRVLILHSYHPGYAWTDQEHEGILNTLRERWPNFEPSVEYLDAKRRDEPEQTARFAEFLAWKYLAQDWDLVLVTDNPALEFALALRAKLFPRASLVFCGINGYHQDLLGGAKGITGVAEDLDLAPTLEVIRDLHPQATEILAISDYTSTGRGSRLCLEKALAQRPTGPKVITNPDWPLDRLLEEIEQSPPHRPILLLSYSRDGAGRSIGLDEFATLLAIRSPVPVYAVHEHRLGRGVVGGYVLSGKLQGAMAARLGLQILDGHDPDNLPVVIKPTSVPMFDYAQLQRFRLDPARLPQDSVVINRPSSFYQSHKALLHLAGAAVLALVVLVVWLSLSNVRRLKAERALTRTAQISEGLRRLLMDLQTCRQVPEMLARLLAGAETVCGMEAGAVYLVEGDVTEIKAHRGFKPEFVELIRRRPLSGEPFPTVSRAEAPVRLDNLPQVWELLRRSFINHFYAAPIQAGGRLIGFLGLATNQETEPEPGAVMAISLLANQAGALLDRLQKEEELRESEERFRQLAEHTQSVFSLREPGGRGRRLYVSPAFERVWGRSTRILDQGGLLATIHPDDRERVAASLKAEEAGQFSPLEYRILRPDGEVRWVASQNFPIHDHAGRLYRVANVSEDVTGRKRAEEQLRQAQKMEAIGTLAGGVAHDFNNLLQAISGYAELLLARKTEGHPDRRELGHIARAAATAAELTKALLTFSRRIESNFRPVELNQVVEQAVALLARTIPRMISLELRLAKDLRQVRADPTQLEQVVVNLALNAKDAMPEGGVLTIATENLTLAVAEAEELTGLSPGSYVLLTVSDTGQGMDPETQGRVFEPFFTTKPLGQGTGLGLAVAYGVVQSHRGRISCSSRPGQGATFKVYLPARSSALDRPAPDQEIEARPEPGQGVILVVDDEPAVRDIAAEILGEAGYAVMTAASGEEALEVYQDQETRIDLVLLDLGMPGMGGLKCLSALMALDPRVKVLVASGYAGGEQARQSLDSGAVGFLAKPYRIRDLLARVREALDPSILGPTAPD